MNWIIAGFVEIVEGNLIMEVRDKLIGFKDIMVRENIMKDGC